MPMHNDHHAVNAAAAVAAQWMHEEMLRNKGTLTQEAAWNGVRERFGDTFARRDQAGCWFSKPILIAFRKLTADAVWDPAGKQWQQRKTKAVDALRMA